MLKQLTKKIKTALSKFAWHFRNVYLTVKRAIGGALKKAWNTVSFKEKRELNKQKKLDFVLNYIGFDPKVLDVQLDLDVVKVREELKTKRTELLASVKQNPNDAALKAELKEVKHKVQFLLFV